MNTCAYIAFTRLLTHLLAHSHSFPASLSFTLTLSVHPSPVPLLTHSLPLSAIFHHGRRLTKEEQKLERFSAPTPPLPSSMQRNGQLLRRGLTSQLLREDILTLPCYRGLCCYRLPKSVIHLGVSFSMKELFLSHPYSCKEPPKNLTGSASWTLVQLLLWSLLGFLPGVSGCVCCLFLG